MKTIQVGNLTIDGSRLFLIAGPCVIEGYDRTLMIGREVKRICEKLGVQYIFKASFDKANRSSYHSFRGPGLEEGLRILKSIKKELDVPVLSDVHDVTQLEKAAEVLDMLQIPAFLCRQTDLIVAAGPDAHPHARYVQCGGDAHRHHGTGLQLHQGYPGDEDRGTAQPAFPAHPERRRYAF